MDLGKGLRDAFRKLTDSGLVDEKAVKEFLRQIQRVLIANDVPVKLVFSLSKNIEKKVLGDEMPKGLSLREQVVRVVYDELTTLMGEKYEPALTKRKILLLGLYGSGKCVHPHTRIPLADGTTKTIEEIYTETPYMEESCDEGHVKKGTSIELFSVEPETLKIRKATGTAIWKLKKTEPLVSVSVDNGNSEKITTTPEHPFFVLENGKILQKRADQIRLEEFVAMPGRLPYEEKQIEFDFLHLLPPATRIVDSDIAHEFRQFAQMRHGSLKEALQALLPKRPYCRISGELKKGEIDCQLLAKAIGLGFEPEFGKNIVLVGGMRKISFPLKMNAELAEFMGYVYGDGNIERNCIHITNMDDEVINRLAVLGKNLFGFSPTIMHEKRSEVNLRRATFASKTLVGTVCGIFGLPRRKKSNIMRLPKFFFNAPTEARRAFLRAYFDCDGYVEEGVRHIEFSTASKEFAYQLRLLLLAEGITSAYSVKKVKGVGYHRIFLRAKEAEIFAKIAGSSIGEKNRRLASLAKIGVGQTCGKLENLNVGKTLKEVREYIGASIGEIQEKVSSYGIYESRGIISRNKLADMLEFLQDSGNANNAILGACREQKSFSEVRQLTAINTAHLNASVWRLRQQGYLDDDESGSMCITQAGTSLMLQNEKFDPYKLEFLKLLSTSDIRWGKVSKIELDENTEYVYDLTVDGTHNFVADNFIVHNTTTCGKIAHFYKSRGLSVGLVTCDTDRPAAYEQLEQLSKKSGAKFYGIRGEKNISVILEKNLPNAKEDIVIVDSAGRSGFDEELVKQLKKIDEILKPDEKILVMSGDIGQVAGRQAKQFHEAVGLTGVILTKMDGSGKGGGALAACHEANVKILYIGTGEKMEDLRPFDSRKFVGNLLGFADFETLIGRIQKVASEEQLEQEDFEELNLETFYKQMKAAKKMGPLDSVLGMMGVHDLPKDALRTSEEKLTKYEAIISSMNKKERKDAQLFKKQKARVARVATGSGTTEKEVRELLNQFDKLASMMGGVKKNRGMRKKLEKFMKGKNVNMDQLGGMMGK